MDGMDELLDRFAAAVADKLAERLQGQKETYTVAELAERYGNSKCTIRRLIANGEFGEPIRVGERTCVIPAEGVRGFEESRKGRRRAERAAEQAGRRRSRPDPGPI